MKHSKIAIIGAGSVGATTAYAILLKKIIAEIILVDIDEVRCLGEILDLSDARAIDGLSKIRGGTAQDAAQADIIIIAAGARQKPGQTRNELLDTNTKIVASILSTITPVKKDAIIIMVTNPLDILTYQAQKILNLPFNQIFGSGTFLDSQRLSGTISKKLGIAQQSVNVYILGEHGDTQFVAWSLAQVAGIPILDFEKINTKDLDQMAQETKQKAYDIISCKGATFYGIAACVATLCQAIIFNQKLVVPLSVYAKEFDVYLSMPCILGETGIESILPVPLSKDEQKKLEHSAQQLKLLLKTVQ